MKKFGRLFKKETGTWALVAATLMIGGFSVWTSNYLYNSRNRNISPASPESEASAAGNCTLTYNLPTPIPCKNLDIVGMSIDRSSSMNSLESDGRTKLAWAKEAAATFVQMVKNSGTTTVDISVNSFGAQGNDGTGTLDSTYNSTLHNSLTNNMDAVLNAVNNVKYIHSGTCIECGLRIGNNQITTSIDKKVAILLSDGRANHVWNGSAPGSTTSKQAAINAANAGRAKGVVYHVIGYGSTNSPVDETTLRAIAGTTGTYQYRPNPQDWSKALLDIYMNACSSTATPFPSSSSTRTVTPSPTRVPTVAPTSSTGKQVLPTADAYTSGSYPTTNYGSSANLYVDNSPRNVTYMKFSLANLTAINKATLYIYVTNGTPDTVNLKNISNDWSESTINFNNAPVLGTTITSFTASSTGRYYTIDMTSWAKARIGQTVSFAVATGSGDGMIFNSRGTTSNKPYILIQ